MRVNTLLAGLLRRGSRVSYDSAVNMGWLLLRAGLLAMWILFAAKLLGASNFAIAAGILAIFALLASASSLGIPFLFFRRASRNRRLLERSWSDCLTAILIVGGLGGTVIFALVFFGSVSGVPPIPLASIALAEALVVPALQALATCAQSLRRFQLLGAVGLVAPFARLVALVIAATGGRVLLAEYLFIHGAIVIAIGTPLLIFGAGRLGMPMILSLPRPRSIRHSIGFAAMSVGYAASTEIDKPIVAKFLVFDLAGPYTFCSRLFLAGTLPVQAVCSALLPYLAAYRGISASRVLSRLSGVLCAGALIYGAMGYALVGAIVPSIEKWLGQSYSNLSEVWWTLGLAFIPLAARQVIALLLIVLNRPWLRVGIDFSAATCLAFAVVVTVHLEDPTFVLLAPAFGEFVGLVIGGVALTRAVGGNRLD